MRAGIVLVVLMGCHASSPPASGKASPPGRCSVSHVLDRHAAAYGTREALHAALPLSTAGEVAMHGKSGTRTLVLDADGTRSDVFVSGLAMQSGIDRVGIWTVGGVVGIRERLRGAEASEIAMSAFLWRREFLDPARTSVDCTKSDRVSVHYELAALGNPTLVFDDASAALLEETHTTPDGVPSRTTFAEWSPADAHGLRWPARIQSGTEAEPVVTTLPPPHAGPCTLLGPNGEKVSGIGAACTAAASDRVSTLWPASGIARVPFTLLGSEILVKVRVAGRDVWAFVDSGAGISVIDSGLPIAASFQSTLQLNGEGATQAVQLGLGVLPVLDVGDLHVEGLPIASVPLPALETFGDHRPELVLGYTLFALGTVRIDFVKGLLEISKRGDPLVKAGARKVPLRVISGKLVADVELEGKTWPIQLDTGNSGAVDLNAWWAAEHGLPGDRPNAVVRGRFGAGTEESSDTFVRLDRAALGPVVARDVLAQISDGGKRTSSIGLVGNALFSRCDAVTFDRVRRTLWLEGTCDHEAGQTTYGWRLGKSEDAKHPWIVRALFPGGSAEQAGVRVGDLLVSVNDRPAGLDVAELWRLEHGPVGSTLPLVVQRAGKPLKLPLVLRVPLQR